jgi:catechol 2,3-dioxygenase-like lactoylglutathione lyase family enzyme
MPITGLTSLGPIFGLTREQSDYALELTYHGWAGAWIKQDHPLQPLMKALWEDRASLSEAQVFCVLHTMLAKACGDWEAPILTVQPPQFAQAAFACLRFEAHSGPVVAIDHVQIAIPPGGEAIAHPFYGDLLGFTQVPKPAPMASRGGAWYQAGHVKVHLGVEQDFRANDKAHVAFVVQDVMALAAAAVAQGYRVKPDDGLPGHMRAFLYDPFGNRIEILRAVWSLIADY